MTKNIKSLWSNTLWVLKLNFKNIPLITITSIIGQIGSYTYGLIQAFSIGLIIDWTIQFINSKDEKYIWYSVICFSIANISIQFMKVCGNYSRNASSFILQHAIPFTLLHEKLHQLSTADLESPYVQNLITRYREDNYAINVVTRNITVLIAVVISLTSIIVTVGFVLPIPALLMAFFAIPSIIGSKNGISKLWKADQDNTVLARRGDNILGIITSPSHLKEVKLINAYPYLRIFFDKYIQKVYNDKNTIYRNWGMIDGLNSALTSIAIGVGIFQIIHGVQNGSISLGKTSFYIAGLISLNSYIDSLITYFTDFAASSVRLTNMRELLEMPVEDKSGKKEIKLTNSPLIQIRNISFAYSGSNKQVVKNLSLDIKPGEKIAIVGENGAGKSTLVKLISNIYQPQKGEILINGINLNNINSDSWFKNLGVLYQDYNTYDDLSVTENIAIGDMDHNVDFSRIKNAAEQADAIEFIEKFDNGFEQILSEKYEGGTRPSTGQWQKLAIARFFYRDAPILIMDEPTASIDAVAEANIFDRIYKFIENKTVIIISHRFSTVRNADRIIVLSDGQIAEEGNHQQLLELNGLYAKAFNTQAKGYK